MLIGYMMVALRAMSGITSTLTFCAIQNDLHYRGTTFLNIKSGEDLVPIFMFIAAIGKYMTGHFELNLMDKVHTMGHYIGVTGISSGTLMVGFCLKWNTLSKVLLTGYFGSAFIFMYYLGTCTKKSKDLKVVTRTSKICLGIELTMFIFYNAILVVTCYASGPNEGNVFASPWL